MTDPGGDSERRRVIAGLVAGLVQLAGCGGSGSGPSNGGTSTQPPPPPAPIDVSVTPAAASTQTGATQTFTATVTNTTNKAVTWQVNGITGGNTNVGTISTAGVYTAPATVPSPPTVTVTAVSVADPTRSGSAQATITATPPPSTSWVWGITTDDSTVQTASQVSAVAAFAKRVTIRTVFDPPVGGSPAATDYLSSVQALSGVADVMGLPVDSSAMSQFTTADISARIAEYLSTLGPYVRIWEIGNEVNGNWLGQDVITKVETMYNAAKAAGKLTALTLYYENPPTPGYEMISWVDQNIPPGHPMRSGLDFVLVSYYEDQNGGHQLTQSELDTMFAALATRFPNARLGFGECGWGGQIPTDDATRAALLQRFYGYRVPSVPAYIGGCFYWEFRQTMVPSGTPDWTVLQSLMSAA
jgi:hypothetical protein